MLRELERSDTAKDCDDESYSPWIGVCRLFWAARGIERLAMSIGIVLLPTLRRRAGQERRTTEHALLPILTEIHHPLKRNVKLIMEICLQAEDGSTIRVYFGCKL
jgi:hypothetical protein